MATRYWVGGTGNWSNTARWSATSGGAGGASVPGTGDAVIFNSSSGGGTATLDSSFTIQTLTMTGYTGTLAYGTNTISLNNTGSIFTGDTTYSVSGTPVINVISVGSTAITLLPGATTEANSVSFNFTGGTYALTFLGLPAGQAAKNVNFTGFAGSWSKNNNIIYGNITIASGMTLVAGTYFTTCAATSGTQVITTNGVLINGSLTINGIGGTVQLADAFTFGSTGYAINLLNGTFDGNSKTISGGNVAAGFSASVSAGSTTIKNIISTGMGMDQSAGTITLGSNVTFGGVVGSNNLGTINLVSYQLNCTGFSSNATNSRTLAFGTGNITINASAVVAGTTVWSTATTTGLTVTGTPVVNISNTSANTITVANGVLTEAQAISFNIINGSYSLVFLSGSGYSAKNVNFTGFSGTWAARSTANSANTIYGNLTLSSGMTIGAAAGIMTFAGTSVTQVITTNGKTFEQPITINGSSATIQLADALLMNAARTVTHTNGTLDLNGKTMTIGGSYATAAGTKVLTFNGGTLVCSAVTTTAFNNAAPTGFSTLAGTGTGQINMTGATSKTFVGGGSTFNCTVSNGGNGALTISGNNTISTLSATAGTTTNITGNNTITTFSSGGLGYVFNFTAGTTQTITNWNANGSVSNSVVLQSATPGSIFTLSKASGIVSGDYLVITDSTATGGATWYAGPLTNSIDGGNNSGWIFTAAPTSTGNFFLLF